MAAGEQKNGLFGDSDESLQSFVIASVESLCHVARLSIHEVKTEIFM